MIKTTALNAISGTNGTSGTVIRGQPEDAQAQAGAVEAAPEDHRLGAAGVLGQGAQDSLSLGPQAVRLHPTCLPDGAVRPRPPGQRTVKPSVPSGGSSVTRTSSTTA